MFSFTLFQFQSAPFVLLAGFLLDCLLGDPSNWPHPVKAIGALIHALDLALNHESLSPSRARARGLLSALILPLFLALLLMAALLALWTINPWLNLLFRVALCYQLLAGHDLRREASLVLLHLRRDGLPAAREQLSHLVGRDTHNLSSEEVVKATIESCAENFSDGLAAPVFFFVLGDLPLMLLYKAVNTNDSMIGYKTERYLNYGWAAARLDDILNFLPARLGALILLASAWPLGLRVREGWRIFRRDRNAHLSPNAGQCEAVAAGCLGLQLGGSHAYFGKQVVKPSLGDNLRPADLVDIERTVHWLFAASWLLTILSMALIILWRSVWI